LVETSSNFNGRYRLSNTEQICLSSVSGGYSGNLGFLKSLFVAKGRMTPNQQIGRVERDREITWVVAALDLSGFSVDIFSYRLNSLDIMVFHASMIG
jgi:hypothetical protein